MLKVCYNPDYCDHLHMDSEVLNSAIQWCYRANTSSSRDIYIETGQELMIEAFRVLVKRGVISHENICFLFKDKMILIDKNGRCDNCPVGFCDTRDKFTEELLDD